MWLYDVSKPTKLQLVREVKSGDSGEYKRLEKKAKTITASDNLKLWLGDFFEMICDVMPMCENQNGSTERHLPSWFTMELVMNEYIRDMEDKIKGKELLVLLVSLCLSMFKCSNNSVREYGRFYPVINNWVIF